MSSICRQAICLPFLLCVSLSQSLHADDKNRYAAPEPDRLAIPCSPERHVAPVPEARLHVPVHVISQFGGIDVSHYQGRINWQMVRTDRNASYVYIKSTESSSLVDSEYRLNMREARLAGIPVGIYHFFSPSASVLTQMRNLADNVDPRQQDLIPILDVEKRGRTSLPEFQGRLRTMLTQMEKFFGCKPIIYTGVNFYNKYLAGKFLDYRFMIARYGEEAPTLCDDNAQIIMWQFTSEGHVNGIGGNVDRSCFLDNYTIQDIRMPK